MASSCSRMSLQPALDDLGAVMITLSRPVSIEVDRKVALHPKHTSEE
jgi:hypothetical protein